MNTPCFLPVAPALPRTRAPSRAPVCMSLRFPRFRNPFAGLRGGAGRFAGFGAGGAGGPPSSGGGSRRGAGRSGSGGGAADNNTNPIASLWAAYNAVLDKHPVTTKAFTSLIGFFLGDLIAQKSLGEKDAPIDKARLARMASFGFLIHGPTGHYFYSALDRAIVGTTPLKVASKVFVDQLLWAPIFTALFFGYLGVAERKNVQQVKDKVKDNTWTGVTTSWKFWPLAHAINFAFIPTNQRLLYINTLQVGYNVILSILGNK